MHLRRWELLLVRLRTREAQLVQQSSVTMRTQQELSGSSSCSCGRGMAKSASRRLVKRFSLEFTLTGARLHAPAGGPPNRGQG